MKKMLLTLIIVIGFNSTCFAVTIKDPNYKYKNIIYIASKMFQESEIFIDTKIKEFFKCYNSVTCIGIHVFNKNSINVKFEVPTKDHGNLWMIINFLRYGNSWTDQYYYTMITYETYIYKFCDITRSYYKQVKKSDYEYDYTEDL